MRFVLDSSALLAVIRDEPGTQQVAAAIPHSAISAVNVSEIVSRLIDLGHSVETADDILAAFAVDIEPFTPEDGIRAGALRSQTRSLGLSLGDRACLATAIRLEATVLTADRAWCEIDVGCPIELIRS